MPSQIDSLKHIVDSLGQQVHDTQIGTGYFLGVLSIQTGVFLFVVAIAAFIAWKSIFYVIKKRHQELTKNALDFTTKINGEIVAMQTEIKEEIEKIKNDNYYAEKQIWKSMYFICDTAKYRLPAFLWSLRIIEAVIKNKVNDTESLNNFNLLIDETITNLITENIEIDKKSFAEAQEILSSALIYKEGIYKDKYEPMLQKISKYYYNQPEKTND